MKQLKLFIAILLVFTVVQLIGQNRIEAKYIVRTFIDDEGNSIDKIIVPGRPPEFHREPAVELPDPSTSDAINILPNIPAFDWVYGCSATSAAMMAGHYDNTIFPQMYTGPTNGGIVPMNNSTWGVGECPLSATHMGYDGLAVRGHVDDYWISYGSTANDPYITGAWTAHSNADCTGDYMGTNQSALGNTDGATTFYYYTDGTPLYDYTGCEPAEKDGCHGLREFFESRGYAIQNSGGNYQNYSQYIYGYGGNTIGFTYSQFKAEIDAGRPVFIQVEGHTMLGYGYDDSSNLVYIHDTWDYSNHIMTWGGSYGGMAHYGVGVFILEDPSLTVTVPNGGESWDMGSSENITWTNQYVSNINIDLYSSGAFVMNIVSSHPASAGSYSWLIPTGLTAGSTYRIRISDSDVASNYDESNADFTIHTAVTPDPVIDVTPTSFTATLEMNQTDTQEMYISNTGDIGSTLTYSLSHGFTDDMDNITGSYIISSPNTFTAGQTTTWNLTVYNASTDLEWLTDVFINFPAGVTVNSGTNFVGGTAGDLVYDGTVGNGAYLHWYDNDGGWGNIYGGEFATATVNVSIHSGFIGDITLDYQINGDLYGSLPHVENGSTTLTQQFTEAWLSYDPNTGSCNQGETDIIDIMFDSTGLTAGTFTADILVTNNGGGPVTIPCTLNVIYPPDIEVDPNSFSENLNTGDTSTQTLTISNDGGENLFVTLSIEETTDGVPLNIKPSNNATSDRSNLRLGHIQPNIIRPDGYPNAFQEMMNQLAQRAIFFTDDMEMGVNGWTTQLYGGTTDDLWHQTNINYNSVNTSWWCGIEGQNNYVTSDRIDTAALSPAIDLTGVTGNTYLYFYENYETELNYDKCMVDVSINGGVNWTPLRGSYSSAPSGSSGGWILTTLDLTSYIGNVINIRFYFDTLDSVANNYAGWFFDDVIITTETFSPSISWLSLSSNACLIPASSAPVNFDVDFDATSLIRGTYTANIIIDSNDPDDPQIIVPVTLEINNNTPTIVLPDDFTFAEDGSLVEDFLPYIDDVDGDVLTLSVAGNTNVTVGIAGSVVTFGAVQDWFGMETLTFTVDDGQTDATAFDDVDVIVTPLNDPPILNITGTFEADEDLPSITYDFSGYCSQTWGETDVLTLSATGSSHIHVTVTGFDVVFESNTLNWNGAEDVTFYLDDNVTVRGRDIISQVIPVTINPVNDAPTIVLPDDFTFAEDGSLVEDFTPYIDDVDGDVLTLSVAGNTNVTVGIAGSVVTFGATQDWFGMETLTFTVDDGQTRATASDNVDVIVTPLNDPPILNITGTFEADEDLPSITYDFSGYCSQTWGETDALTLSATGSSHIGVTVTGFDVVFESNTLNWNGTEDVTFYLDDNVTVRGRDVVSQVIPVTINSLNDPPTIVLPDDFTFDEDDELIVDFAPYINDVDGDVLTLSVAGNTNVTVGIAGSVVTFGVTQDWFGMETLTFTVDDGQTRATASDNVDVIVTPLNDPPILNITGTFEADEDLPSITYDFSGYCSQTWGETDALTLSATGSSHIDVTVTGFDVVFESNTLNWNGTEDVTFYLDDNVTVRGRDIVSQVISVTINSLNDPPTIVLPDDFTFDEDGSLVEDFDQYIGDVDEDDLTLSVTGNVNVTVNIDGTIVTFGATENWNGTETLTFIVDDNVTRATAEDDVDVIVIPVNDEPVLLGYFPEELEFTVIIDSIVTFSVDAEDIDSDLNYAWYVDEELQTETTDTFEYQFIELGEIIIKSLISDEEYEIETIWTVTVESGAGVIETLPVVTKLYQNHPNPFNPTTTICFDLVNAGTVTLNIYNIKGELVRTLDSGNYPTGQHAVIWNGKDDNDKSVSSGVYFYHLKTKNYNSFRKAILLK